jgi:hypothetical protein
MPDTPLLIRWSCSFGTRRSAQSGRLPEPFGFHLEVPKSVESILAVASSTRVARGVERCDPAPLLRQLGLAARKFATLEDWRRRRPTPALLGLIGHLLYVDRGGIERLFDESGKTYLDSVIETASADTAEERATGLNIDKLLALVGVQFARKSTRHITKSEQVTRRLGLFDKLNIILDEMVSRGALQTWDVDNDPTEPKHLTNVISEIIAWFETSGEIQRANQAGDLDSEFLRFSSTNKRVIVGVSAAKLAIGWNHVCASLQNVTRLRVIGVPSATKGILYIKPYAVWITDHLVETSQVAAVRPIGETQ